MYHGGITGALNLDMAVPNSTRKTEGFSHAIIEMNIE
ncbi:MAG: hypothetical protein FD169_1705 [Bacillota bacterium]|nr:MAG: hypothetical protein FD169_1705 [Bacillota bacterium]